MEKIVPIIDIPYNKIARQSLPAVILPGGKDIKTAGKRGSSGEEPGILDL